MTDLGDAHVRAAFGSPRVASTGRNRPPPHIEFGRLQSAAASFAESAGAAAEAARAEGHDPGDDFAFRLAEGYRGLALGDETFDRVCAVFDADASEDALFGAAQLRCLRDRLAMR